MNESWEIILLDIKYTCELRVANSINITETSSHDSAGFFLYNIQIVFILGFIIFVSVQEK